MKKFIIISITILLIFSFITTFLFYNGYLWLVYPDNKKYNVMGIDISHHQKTINWNELKKNKLSFIFIKATEGGDYIDNKYKEYKNNAKKSNLAVGAYHFYSLRFKGKEQAENFINTVNRNDIDLPPVIDLEFGGNSKKRPQLIDFEKQINEYIDRIKENYCKDPIIYTTYDFYNKYLSKILIESEYYLWIRNIFFKPGKIHGNDWTFWQYKNRGRVKGIDGFVDLNVYKYSPKEFKNFIEYKE